MQSFNYAKFFSVWHESDKRYKEAEMDEHTCSEWQLRCMCGTSYCCQCETHQCKSDEVMFNVWCESCSKWVDADHQCF